MSTTLKTIKLVQAAQKVNMGGHILDQPLPTRQIDYVDPFLLIHHWKSELKGGQKQNEVGVGPHPHRGFSPVTFVFKGNVAHRDSLGNYAVVHEGGTQWMFAGRGITHSERQDKNLTENGGAVEFIQFWVNAPAKNKMDKPFYLPISLEETPVIATNQSKIWVVSGTLNNVEGIAPSNSPQLLLRGELAASGKVKIDIPQTFNTILYILDGKVEVDEKTLEAKDMAIFNTDGACIELFATEKTRYIVLSGEPLNEPVESYGPFVMNSQTEVMQAVRDAQMGKMGVLIEEFE